MTDSPIEHGVERPSFESQLEEGRDRFLAHAIEHALSSGRRSPEDFLRFFPPLAIMKGLADAPGLRARILVEATGLKERIAARKPWKSAAEDLEIALAEKETNAAAILSGFDPDARVRYLARSELWAFLVEGDFWNCDPSSEDFATVKEHVAFILERALVDQVLTPRDIVEGITTREISARLPKMELGAIIDSALDAGHRNTPFTEAELLAALPPSVLVNHVPIPRIWKGVVTSRIVERHELAQAAPPASHPSTGNSGWPVPPEEPQEDASIDEDDISEDDFRVP